MRVYGRARARVIVHAPLLDGRHSPDGRLDECIYKWEAHRPFSLVNRHIYTWFSQIPTYISNPVWNGRHAASDHISTLQDEINKVGGYQWIW